MEIYYQGKNISRVVNITKCIHRDVASGRADSLEIEFDHAAAWFSWRPEKDDTIQIVNGSYDTGRLYLNTILPQGDHYRIIATSLPSLAARRAWFSFENATLEDILNRCSAECGMKYKLYGVDGRIRYAYILRRNEGCAALLNRLAQWEGLFLKAYNGVFRAIGMEYAQDQEPVQRITATPDQDGIRYTRQENGSYAALTVSTPYAQVTAKDAARAGGITKIITDLPARNAAEAGRWARGLLKHANRAAETLTIASAFNPRMCALARVNVAGNTDATGEWIAEDVTQDIREGRTTATLRRVMTGIS